MRAQFLKTVGLLFNFLVAFEANQGVTLSGTDDAFSTVSTCFKSDFPAQKYFDILTFVQTMVLFDGLVKHQSGVIMR